VHVFFPLQSALGASLQEGLLHTPQAGPTPAGVIPVQLLPNVWNAHAVPQQQYIYTAPNASYSTMQMAPNYYSPASVNGEASETGSSAAPSGFVMVPNEQSYINYQVGLNANSSFNSYNNWANYANWAAAGSQPYVPEYTQWQQQQQQGAGASPGQMSSSSHMQQHHLSYSPHTPSHMQQLGSRGGVSNGLSGLSVRGYVPVVTPHYSAARLSDPAAARASSAAAGTYVTNLDPRTMR
jgi:hypothetical protein